MLAKQSSIVGTIDSVDTLAAACQRLDHGFALIRKAQRWGALGPRIGQGAQLGHGVGELVGHGEKAAKRARCLLSMALAQAGCRRAQQGRLLTASGGKRRNHQP